jgi:probable F420-dependent oxidoreductase
MHIDQVHVALGSGGARAEVVEVATLAERLGFGGLWLTELASREAFGLLTEIALGTHRIELGTGVVNPFSRTPALLAMSAATLAEVARRPVNLGLGSSSRKVIEDLHGMPFARPALRMAETLEIIRRALSGQRLDYAGRLFRLRDFSLEVSAPDVRLYVAGFSSPILEVTGRLADGWLPIHPSRRGIGALLADIRSAADAHGRAMPTVGAYLYAYVGERLEEGVEAIRRTISWYVANGGEGYRTLFRRYGYAAEVTRITELWRAGRRDEARAVVDAGMLADLSVIAPPSQVAERLAEFVAVGIDHPILRFPDGLPTSRVAEMLEAVARALPAAA